MEEHTTTYKVAVLFDNTPSLATPHSVSKATHLSTASSSAACGVNLQVGAIYLIKSHLPANLALTANLCSTYTKVLLHVPTAQEAKELFANLYKAEC